MVLERDGIIMRKCAAPRVENLRDTHAAQAESGYATPAGVQQQELLPLHSRACDVAVMHRDAGQLRLSAKIDLDKLTEPVACAVEKGAADHAVDNDLAAAPVKRGARGARLAACNVDARRVQRLDFA